MMADGLIFIFPSAFFFACKREGGPAKRSSGEFYANALTSMPLV
jgi:hypothetical protein